MTDGFLLVYHLHVSKCDTVCLPYPLLTEQGGAADGLRQTGSEGIPSVNVFQPTLILNTHMHACIYKKQAPRHMDGYMHKLPIYPQ